jgi:hypothetical protein
MGESQAEGGVMGDVMAAIRRREIERYARTIGVADSDDFPTFLVAWQWHNAGSKDPVGALQEAARRMLGHVSHEEAERLVQEAAATRQRRKADPLARWLQLPDKLRTVLGIRTIGSIDVSSKQRARRRKERDRINKANKRRAKGAKSRAEYLADSLMRTQPWKKEKISQRTWYRRRKHQAGGGHLKSKATILNASQKDKQVTYAAFVQCSANWAN